MNESPPPKRRRRFYIRIALASCCLGAFLLWLFWNPFERIHKVEPLASRDFDWTSYSSHASDYSLHHAAGRDELVFVRDSAFEVYHIDADLTRVRVVPFKVEGEQLLHVATFPNSPRALIETSEGMFIVNTETGQVERRLASVWSGMYLVLSPDERWLALSWAKVRVEGGNNKQAGSYPLAFLDLQADTLSNLDDSQMKHFTARPEAFVGPNALLLSDYEAGRLHVWQLPDCKLIATAYVDEPRFPFGFAVRESVLVTGSHNTCDVWDVKMWNLKPLRSHSGTNQVRAVAINPKTGDYLAAYSSKSFSQNTLAGAVRIWNAEGERLTTFAAHRDRNWPAITWIAVSTNGQYLVTTEERSTLKVWDYATVARGSR